MLMRMTKATTSEHKPAFGCAPNSVTSLVTDQACSDQAISTQNAANCSDIQEYMPLCNPYSLVTDQAAGVTQPARRQRVSSNLAYHTCQVQWPVCQYIGSELNTWPYFPVKLCVKSLDLSIYP